MFREDTWNSGFVAEDDRALLQYSGKLCHCSHGRRSMKGKTVSKGVTNGLNACVICSAGGGGGGGL